MDVTNSKGTLFFVLGLIANFISAYLFALNLISLMTLIFIVSGFVVVLIIVGIQSINNEFEEFRKEQKRLIEKLKIHEQLVDIKSDIKFLMRKNGKK